nr:glutathione S-transferase N-terminal domain-containing protein [Mangrovicoccus ximenensis]
MQVFHSATSPFVRKVLVLAAETGQSVETLASAANPVNRDPGVVAQNPTGKVPTALLPDGSALHDSRVICRWLDTRHDGPKMYPDGEAVWDVLRREALADGLLDAAVLARYETMLRPKEKQWEEWLIGQMDKIGSSLDVMERDVAGYASIDAGWIAFGCALGYLDFRFAGLGWRDGHPALAAWHAEIASRKSFKATEPPC